MVQNQEIKETNYVNMKGAKYQTIYHYMIENVQIKTLQGKKYNIKYQSMIQNLYDTHYIII